MKKLLFVCLLATGCSTAPIVDPKSSSTPANFYADKTECEAIAGEVSYSWEMAKSAAIHGVLSALVGYASGGSDAAGIGAASGTVVGAGKGAWDTSNTRGDILRRCLEGRGYKVLR